MNNTSQVEHEASTSKISEEQLFYLQQRGISQEDAVSLIINGFCKEVFLQLPMEYAVEATAAAGAEAGRKCRIRTGRQVIGCQVTRSIVHPAPGHPTPAIMTYLRSNYTC